ncbi:MAG: hypothetical protein HN712_27520 [Gemmatimonadetes bacterium]|jgi:hypothetical protein|nr:hypothetical protein [Gemmatimonadota bacterium]MBT6144071.1 hypothetical protein [Gemmatimonadota bacterium]MBT7864091.1 hypothetical protein [Gemmatimonadota bacterium]
MFADILPAILPVAVAIVAISLVMRSSDRREGYCQKSMKYCFWCSRKCDFFALQEKDTQQITP